MSSNATAGDKDKNGYIPNRLTDALVGDFQALCGYSFRDLDYLKRALLHSSAVVEPHRSNERMEFLGDGILSFLMAEILYERYADASEGILTQFRSQLVSTRALAEVAESLSLDRFIHFGDSLFDGKLSKRVMANAVEAVIAAIYFDGGLESAREFIHAHIACKPAGTLEQTAEPRNFKALLQQWTQEIGPDLPVYRTVDSSGPPHKKMYTVVVEYGGMTFRGGYGQSKKEAEQHAAKNALDELFQLADEKH